MNNVDHPRHYGGKTECIDAMLFVYGDEALASFCLLNAFKYIWRMGEKNGNSHVQDLAKAKWYYRRYFVLKNGREPNPSEMTLDHIKTTVKRFKYGDLEADNGV